ncbi:MAG: hypothetical protein ACLS8R_04200 [Anaeromassilibacillus sp.]
MVVTDQESGESKSYLIPFGSRIIVNEGDVIEKGTRITEGWSTRTMCWLSAARMPCRIT